MIKRWIQEIDFVKEIGENHDNLLTIFIYQFIDMIIILLEYLGKKTDFQHHVTPAPVYTLTPYFPSSGRMRTAFCNAFVMLHCLCLCFLGNHPLVVVILSDCFKVKKQNKDVGQLSRNVPLWLWYVWYDHYGQHGTVAAGRVT